MRVLESFSQNISVAIDALRAGRLRSALTILGVVIGVATVMTMASIVSGIRRQILSSIEVAGPTTFYVFKAFSSTPVNPDAPPKWMRVRPDLRESEVTRIAELPEVGYAAIWGITVTRLEYQGAQTQPNRIYGADDRFQELMGGDLIQGRWFTKSELSSGANVAVVDESYARKLLGRAQPIGKTIRAGGRPVEIIGLYNPASNLFLPPGTETAAVIPYRMLDQQFTLRKEGEVFFTVKPRAGVTVEQAQEAAAVAMREMRGLRPADPNNFDFVTQEQILTIFTKLTTAFFAVMIALSSVALLVGGIGVMAIMMVSVTSRTREIGVRKAMGATRRDILIQFLIEAATLTGIGGAIGILFGLGFGRVVAFVLGVSAPPPIALTLLAVTVSVTIGVMFGLVPARRAAQLDPIEALRYE